MGGNGDIDWNSSQGGGSGGGPSTIEAEWTAYPSRKRKEADRIEALGKYPTTPQWAGWRRNSMRALAAAAAVPQMATDMILRAEEWEGKPEAFIVPPQWENMDAKFGRELTRTAS